VYKWNSNDSFTERRWHLKVKRAYGLKVLNSSELAYLGTAAPIDAKKEEIDASRLAAPLARIDHI
jgi:hypothetical protein